MTPFEEKDKELVIKAQKWALKQNNYIRAFGYQDPSIDEQIYQIQLERANNLFAMHKALTTPDPLWKRILNVFDPYA